MASIEQGTEPQTQWSRLLRTFWFADGRIGLAVTDPPFVRVYSQDGQGLTAFGAPGEGPGEMQGVIWGGALGDSALVRDRRGVHVFGPRGSYARRVPLPLEAAEIIHSHQGGWVTAAQTIVEDDHSGLPEPPEVVRDWTVVAFGSDGLVRDTLAEFTQMPAWAVQQALWGDYHHTISDGASVYEMSSFGYEIRVHRGGSIERLLRAPISTLDGFEQRHFEPLEEAWGAVAAQMLERDREAGRLVVPSALDLVLSGDGKLWVRRTDEGPTAPVRTWDVFDDRGRWEATIDTPPEFMISAVRDRHVLGVWTDRLDVTSVRIYQYQLEGI